MKARPARAGWWVGGGGWQLAGRCPCLAGQAFGKGGACLARYRQRDCTAEALPSRTSGRSAAGQARVCVQPTAGRQALGCHVDHVLAARLVQELGQQVGARVQAQQLHGLQQTRGQGQQATGSAGARAAGGGGRACWHRRKWQQAWAGAVGRRMVAVRHAWYAAAQGPQLPLLHRGTFAIKKQEPRAGRSPARCKRRGPFRRGPAAAGRPASRWHLAPPLRCHTPPAGKASVGKTKQSDTQQAASWEQCSTPPIRRLASASPASAAPPAPMPLLAKPPAPAHPCERRPLLRHRRATVPSLQRRAPLGGGGRLFHHCGLQHPGSSVRKRLQCSKCGICARAAAGGHGTRIGNASLGSGGGGGGGGMR